MSLPAGWTPNPALDLVLERLIDLTPAQVWAAWTTPEHVMKWFTPAPWTVAVPSAMSTTTAVCSSTPSTPTSAGRSASMASSRWDPR